MTSRFQQSEAAECGLAAIALVANHHGLQLDLREARRRFPLSMKGATLKRLIEIATALGLSGRPLSLGLEAIHRLKLPCILHWNMDHFVVLTKVGRSKLTIVDPARGERRLSFEEASRHFTGVALELEPNADFRPRAVAPAVTARQLVGPVRGLRRALLQILLLSLALQGFVILAPFFIQWVVDQVLVSGDRDLLAVLGLGFALVLVLGSAVGALRGWSVVYLASRLGTQWTVNVFAHLLKLPLEFFEKRHLGDIVSRIGSVQTIQRTLTTSFVEAMIDGLMALVTLGFMLVYNWRLACLTLLAVLAYSVVRTFAYAPVRDHTEQQLVAGARQQSFLLESLQGIQSLKIVGEESQRLATFSNLAGITADQDMRLGWLRLGFNGASQLIFGIERIAVIWMGAILALDNVFSVGMLIAYLAYKDQFAERTASLIDKWLEFRMLRLHGERLADIVLSEPEEGFGKPEQPLPHDIRIEVDSLSFRYADGEPWVLKDCSFSISPGESVAIVGASGCGKTTLLKLLLGLLQPTGGEIRVAGCELHKLGPRNLRSVVGVVMQDDQLFTGSIADNIAFFDFHADPAKVEAAARLAAVHDEVAAMPMGYHSLIGDMGSALSGGQKQRVILARALYRNPRILFLDEATSHLDVDRERAVNDAVRNLALTKVIVAHRPETIASADRVLVLQGGCIVEERSSRAGRLATDALPAPGACCQLEAEDRTDAALA
ncbi:MAG: peptidase domain-containing ABC transporter [Lysobacteraceae bacterium]